MGRKGKGKAGRLLRVYHRRAGIISVLVVLILTVTGISLNHIDRLYQDSPYVKSGWLLDWYGIEATEVLGFSRTTVGNDEPSSIVMAEGTLIANRQPLLFDQEQLLGVFVHDDLNHVFTRDSLHIFTDDGRLVESISLTEHSLAGFDAVWMGEAQNLVLLENMEETVVFSLDTLLTTDTSMPDDYFFPLAGSSTLITGKAEDAELARQFVLLKSRVLTDIHSGRILGPIGPWLVDLFALVFLSLALSGLVIWFRRKTG